MPGCTWYPPNHPTWMTMTDRIETYGDEWGSTILGNLHSVLTNLQLRGSFRYLNWTDLYKVYVEK